MRLSSDQLVLWTHGVFHLNATMTTTWVLVAVMAAGSWFITRKVAASARVPRWQGVAEVIVIAIRGQISEIGLSQPDRYLGFLGTLFLFIAVSNLCTVLPFYEPPTGSLSTTAALAACTFLAVPFYAIRERGVVAFLKSYLKPTPFMLPFNILSEITRTLALAVRLFGNIMSGSMIVAILLTITPFLFPAAMAALGLLTGMVQAYIFTVLAAVYIAAASTSQEA